jgi:hypothetical protein
MNRTVTSAGRMTGAPTPGRQGLASVWVFVTPDAAMISGLAIRIAWSRVFEQSTTASRCMTPIWGAARPTP